MYSLLTQLGDLTIAEFLRDYWQQKPLLIRQAFPNFRSSIDANELAGLAMEDFVESRLVKTKDWQLEHGPFTEQQLTTLPDKDWTLLVQGVDQLVPDVAELLESFRFLPSWRLDDIMVSYATDGGSVGPHFDHYDVFLLQAEGNRRWRLGGHCTDDVALIENIDLAILQNFNSDQEWLLEPGDMLYIPPKLAHWGVAEGECMTYSIGFRAPSLPEMVSSYCDYSLQSLTDKVRYRDTGLLSQSDSYKIEDDVIQQVRQMLQDALDNPNQIARWFGSHMTTPRYLDLPTATEKSCGTEGLRLQRSTNSRLAYAAVNEQVFLFANGEQWPVSATFARFICDNRIFDHPILEAKMESAEDQLAYTGLLELGVLDTV